MAADAIRRLAEIAWEVNEKPKTSCAASTRRWNACWRRCPLTAKHSGQTITVDACYAELKELRSGLRAVRVVEIPSPPRPPPPAGEGAMSPSPVDGNGVSRDRRLAAYLAEGQGRGKEPHPSTMRIAPHYERNATVQKSAAETRHSTRRPARTWRQATASGTSIAPRHRPGLNEVWNYDLIFCNSAFQWFAEPLPSPSPSAPCPGGRRCKPRPEATTARPSSPRRRKPGRTPTPTRPASVPPGSSWRAPRPPVPCSPKPGFQVLHAELETVAKPHTLDEACAVFESGAAAGYTPPTTAANCPLATPTASARWRGQPFPAGPGLPLHSPLLARRLWKPPVFPAAGPWWRSLPPSPSCFVAPFRTGAPEGKTAQHVYDEAGLLKDEDGRKLEEYLAWVQRKVRRGPAFSMFAGQPLEQLAARRLTELGIGGQNARGRPATRNPAGCALRWATAILPDAFVAYPTGTTPRPAPTAPTWVLACASWCACSTTAWAGPSTPRRWTPWRRRLALRRGAGASSLTPRDGKAYAA